MSPHSPKTSLRRTARVDSQGEEHGPEPESPEPRPQRRRLSVTETYIVCGHAPACYARLQLMFLACLPQIRSTKRLIG